MADIIGSHTLLAGPRRAAFLFTNVYVDTGESAVVKIDKSSLLNADGVEPSYLQIVKAQWAVNGYKHVRVQFDHTADDEALVLVGTGELYIPEGLKDPQSAGGTGDIVFTTGTPDGAGACYQVYLEVLLGSGA